MMLSGQHWLTWLCKQIGDLLAEITGGQTSSAPSPKPTLSTAVKRKAEDVSNGATATKFAKAQQPDGTISTSKVSRDSEGRVVERSYSVSRPLNSITSSMSSASLPHRTSSPSTNGRYEPPTPTSQQRLPTSSNGKLPTPSSSSIQQKRPSEASSRPTKLSHSSSSSTKVPPSKPSPTTPTMSGSSQAPKKSSFKEIMARGAKAQEMMGKVGLIQHKPIDKAVAKKEREVTKPEHKPGIGTGVKGKTGPSYAGSARSVGSTGRDNGRTVAPARDVARNGAAGKEAKTGTKSKPSSSADVSAEKKVRKSAVATTGYAGTARPRPAATTGKGPSKSDQRPRLGGLLAPPRAKSYSREDEYDDELDDFIEYDEDDDGPGVRTFDYDSEGSSDMEAGLSDIDTEERRAERAAIEEDKREKALEEKLKREKEERKRRLAQGGR